MSSTFAYEDARNRTDPSFRDEVHPAKSDCCKRKKANMGKYDMKVSRMQVMKSLPRSTLLRVGYRNHLWQCCHSRPISCVAARHRRCCQQAASDPRSYPYPSLIWQADEVRRMSWLQQALQGGPSRKAKVRGQFWQRQPDRKEPLEANKDLYKTNSRIMNSRRVLF
jgi:hypothetical protein